MTRNISILLLLLVAAASCKKTDEFLTKYPLEQITDEAFWQNEESARIFAWGFYKDLFPGYSQGFDLGWGGYFAGEALNDDFAPTTPTVFNRNIPPTDVSRWDFRTIRRANLMIDRVQRIEMPETAKKNWIGIGRFFRGLEYANKVKLYGDYPWYSVVLEETDVANLYRPRDPRSMVMDSVLADFKYAAENVLEKDEATGQKGLIVNKWVVLAFMSRVFLFEGSWQKYHLNNAAKANEYFEAAKWAANEVMTKGDYSLATDYRKMFNSVDLGGNPEMILYRRYDNTAGVMHSLHTYVNKEPQTGASKNAIESYLCTDGLPIALSPKYKQDKTITDVMTDRDPRMYYTFVRDSLRLNGHAVNHSTTGYAVHKFFNEEIQHSNDGLSQTNITDAPVIRLGEVLMNYAEAAAELGTITQADLNVSINRLRQRKFGAYTQLPDLQVMGVEPAVNNTIYDDPKRDPNVPSLLWEIRRERRTELMMEGFRTTDLRRWKKYEYVDTKTNIDINRGAWIRKSNYPKLSSAVVLDQDSVGYIIPSTKPEAQRTFHPVNDEFLYLVPLPIDQITLYANNGVELKQNPNWK